MARPAVGAKNAGSYESHLGETLLRQESVEHRAADLRRLKVAGVGLPVLFFLTIELVRLGLTESGGFGFHTLLLLFIVLAVIGFSFLMFHFIERAQAETAAALADLERRQREGQGFYDVLLRISNQEDLAEVLAAVARQARDLLAGDDAAVCLDGPTTRSVRLDAAPSAAPHPGGVCISPRAGGSFRLHRLDEVESLPPSSGIRERLRVQIRSRGASFGELWVGRRSPQAFSERDRLFLDTLSDLASIALTSARMRETEQQGAILAERQRIARELHDSLAQVLGTTHLRLRALGSSGEPGTTSAIAARLEELADICEEGYRDARGAILDLHESSRRDLDLLDALRRYLDKYSHQCGVETSLETRIEGGLSLSPHSEIQIIRVIQEALTNVRKHSGADSAVVTVEQRSGSATFVVEDNGRGFDSAVAPLERDGFGLHAMRERMELIGGTLRTESASGSGTRVVAELPVPPSRAAETVEIDAYVG